MRSADAATLFRALLAIIIAYLIIARFSPIAIILLIGFTLALDAFDGYLAVRDISKGRVGIITYLKYAAGSGKSAAYVRSFKHKVSERFRFGPRMDIAGDRVVEYVFWITFTYVHAIPLFVLFIVVIRHSFVDALMGAKGTSSKLKTRFAKVIYSSSIGRGGINVVKFAAFSYLALAYIWGYPAYIGYVLVTLLLAYILLRGAAEVYESIA